VSADRSVEAKEVEALLSARNLDGARALLARVEAGDHRFDVLRVKLGLYDGSLPPGAAMQELIKIMRRDEEFPGARALYNEASEAAYAARQSNVAHSHPPPPVRKNPGESKA
jgi:hypothetical protein